MAAFPVTFKANTGLDLYGLSVQNEPDITASYESMIMSDAEIVDFVNVLGPKLALLAPKPKLIVGEHANWYKLPNLAAAIEANAPALAATDIYAEHQYVGVSPYTARPRPIWENRGVGIRSL
jgi:O-glycosyl hydrolase